MKRILVVIAIIASFIAPPSAHAANTKFNGGPLTNLDSPASIHIALSSFPTKGGLYVMQCAEGVAGARPTLCNNSVQLWISTAQGASFAPTADIVLKPTATFTSGTTLVDCTVTKCGIFLRYDHTVANDLTEDQFIPITFKSVVSGTPTLASDVVTATINGIALSTKQPFKLAYRQFATLTAKSQAGATLTYASLAPACTLNGMEIVALKGSGFCDIAITSAGTATAAGMTAHFPLELTMGVQTIGDFTFPTNAKAGQKIELPTLTNFGEKISYKTSGGCSVAIARATIKKGTCKIMITAPGKADAYKPLKLTYTIKGK